MPTSTPIANDPSLCPLCGGPNNCQRCKASSSREQCWCFTVEISQNVLDQVPVEARDKACVCLMCVVENQPQNSE